MSLLRLNLLRPLRRSSFHQRYLNGQFSSRLSSTLYGFNDSIEKKQIEKVSSSIRTSLRIADPSVSQNQFRHSAVYNLVTNYRTHGHKKSYIDPLQLQPQGNVPELHHASELDLSSAIDPTGIVYGMNNNNNNVASVIEHLEKSYCSSLSAEFTYLETAEEREWFAHEMETRFDETFSDGDRLRFAKSMLEYQAVDRFLAVKFPTVKRYGCEGAEPMAIFFDEMFRLAVSNYKLKEVQMGMPHRGRNNVLLALLGFSPALFFRKIRGASEFPPNAPAAGDVLAHLNGSFDLPNGLHVNMLPNPSHLEVVGTVAAGRARARQQSIGEGPFGSGRLGDGVVCLQIHGDAAFSAQGIIAEGFCLSRAPHFTCGGSVHLVVNNQIGFTTPSTLGRSSRYCSDVAKMVAAPVLHVNGADIEEVARAAKIALHYRQQFRKDVVVDLVTFRRWGHNEVDEPSLTQPAMYQRIAAIKSIPDSYAADIKSRIPDAGDKLEQFVSQWTAKLQQEFDRANSYEPKDPSLGGRWSSMRHPGQTLSTWDTGVPADLLRYVGARSVTLPEGFEAHKTLQKSHVERRLQRMEQGTGIDWATAEALAFGSLLLQGFSVRLSGQDVSRGTFSHRHIRLWDQSTMQIHEPLNQLIPEQKTFIESVDSPLTEEAVMAFEFGFSTEHPQKFSLWEAQFGDFFNGAQIIIDTFVSSAHTKWLQQSALVLLLPHGMDGTGPEHSSARIERFLQMSDSHEDRVDGEDVAWSVVFPTTPSQYFHLLRRQMIRDFRRPMVVISPKILLRFPDCVSSLADMAEGTAFEPVLSQTKPQATKVIFCTGKHFYALQSRCPPDTAIVRIEELVPFPAVQLEKVIRSFPNAKEFVWSQEEHRNNGAWSFVEPRFRNILGVQMRYAGRGPLCCPAVGIAALHKKEEEELFRATFGK